MIVFLKEAMIIATYSTRCIEKPYQPVLMYLYNYVLLFPSYDFFNKHLTNVLPASQQTCYVLVTLHSCFANAGFSLIYNSLF